MAVCELNLGTESLAKRLDRRRRSSALHTFEIPVLDYVHRRERGFRYLGRSTGPLCGKACVKGNHRSTLTIDAVRHMYDESQVDVVNVPRTPCIFMLPRGI